MIGARKLICPALLLCAGLTGCGTLKLQTPAEVIEASRPVVIQLDDVEKLPQYFEQIRKLPAPELSREFERVRQGFAKGKGDVARLQLALFATLSNASFGDNARALALLEPMLKERPGASPARSFAILLHAMLTEQKKLEESVQGLSQKLKEEQRREDALQKQLDALKEMETNLMERERTRPIKKP